MKLIEKKTWKYRVIFNNYILNNNRYYSSRLISIAFFFMYMCVFQLLSFYFYIQLLYQLSEFVIVDCLMF